MEAGESPARSRHCTGRAFFHKPLREIRLPVGSERLGKEKKCEDTRVRRHAQMGNQFTASAECRWILLLAKLQLPTGEMKSQKTAKTGCCQSDMI